MFSENRDPLESYGNREGDVQYGLDKSLVLACGAAGNNRHDR